MSRGGFSESNYMSRRLVSPSGNDAGDEVSQNETMPDHLAPDWYLREWMAELGKRQADLVNERGWQKGRASKFFHGQYTYRREVVNDVAEWLGIRPYELLMHPSEAMAMRRLRESAMAIAAEDGVSFDPAPRRLAVK